ncbi:MAG: uracil-DNA glycosylase [Acidobacteriaceae bacterium]|jgi:DNA polymerase
MQGDAGPQLRAWVEYFRDLGVHDFYRRGEVAPALAAEAGSDLPTQSAAMMDAVPNRGSVIAAAAESVPAAEYAAPALHLAADVPAPQLIKLVSFNNLAPIPAERVPPADRPAALRAIQEEIGDCTRCPLAYAGRHKIVFGDGSATARLMFVGEGPGADEDAQGLPFVGKAGQLLNNMIAAMGLARAEVYIANIVKCRPPGNRVPEPEEANTCSQFLLRQIDVVQPEVIVALGSTAAIYLLGVRRLLSALRGHWHTCRGAKLAVTYHPAFLLRDPRQKAEAWKDLQMVMAEMGLTPPARK